MPTFCRHNRFIERCPICSKTLPGGAPAGGRSSRDGSSTRRSAGPRASATSGTSGRQRAGGRRRARGESLRVRHEDRAQDDGYRSGLLPGVHASADAARLAEEIAFSSGRLIALAAAPWGLYGQARARAAEEPELASWTCFLIVYLGPLEEGDPFAGIRLALERHPPPCEHPEASWFTPGDLDGIPLGPRTCHDPARGVDTLNAYRSWVQRAGGSQSRAFAGDPGWSPARRFERLFERLALPGFARTGRYELLVTLGALGLYELRGDSLQMQGAGGLSPDDLTTLAAKRLFAIGDPIHMERRAEALAQAAGVPLQALDLALANWSAHERATFGCPPGCSDSATLERTRGALGL